MNDRVRIVPFYKKSLGIATMRFRIQMKIVWLRIGPLKFFRWKTVGEYTTYSCAVMDAKIAVKCLSNKWEEKTNDQR